MFVVIFRFCTFLEEVETQLERKKFNTLEKLEFSSRIISKILKAKK